MTRTIIETRNRKFGFFGTMMQAGHNPFEAWDAANAAIASAINDHEGYTAKGFTAKGIRDFLNSHHGRHFADTLVSNIQRGLPLEVALSEAITEWQGRRIDRRTSRDKGIPAGLPYLTGWVQHFASINEAFAALAEDLLGRRHGRNI